MSASTGRSSALLSCRASAVDATKTPRATALMVLRDTLTSAATLRANQLRLYCSSVAFTLLAALRRLGLAGTALAKAQCTIIRLTLLKIGARNNACAHHAPEAPGPHRDRVRTTPPLCSHRTRGFGSTTTALALNTLTGSAAPRRGLSRRGVPSPRRRQLPCGKCARSVCESRCAADTCSPHRQRRVTVGGAPCISLGRRERREHGGPGGGRSRQGPIGRFSRTDTPAGQPRRSTGEERRPPRRERAIVLGDPGLCARGTRNAAWRACRQPALSRSVRAARTTGARRGETPRSRAQYRAPATSDEIALLPFPENPVTGYGIGYATASGLEPKFRKQSPVGASRLAALKILAIPQVLLWFSFCHPGAPSGLVLSELRFHATSSAGTKRLRFSAEGNLPRSDVWARG